MGGHDDPPPPLAGQRPLVPVGDTPVGGPEGGNPPGKEGAHVGLRQTVADLPYRELYDHVVRVAREREVEDGGGGDPVGVVVPEDTDALTTLYSPRDPAGRRAPRLLLRRVQGLQRRRE